jgi:hypothetical protein
MQVQHPPKLLRRLPIHLDETLVSFVQRHCAANYVRRMPDMLRLIGRLAGQRIDDVRDTVSHIQEKLDPRACVVGPVMRLGAGRDYGLDDVGMAWAISQVRGGSLAAVGWPSPYQLVDLTVDAARLRALVASRDWRA